VPTSPSASSYQLAQINIGRILAPIDDPQIADFVGNLDRINALADNHRGFVWRFQTDEGNATAVRPYEDATILVNMSVWETIEALANFVYRSAHTAYLRRRREWFEPMTETITALWWVPAGRVPSIDEGIERLEHLRAHGPSPEAFTFRDRFPAPLATDAVG
jgi:Domain of unknown function (DUF3291)